MGAKHITPAEIKQFVQLYEKYGTYKAVAEKTNRSRDAVSKHIKLYYAANLAELKEESEVKVQKQGKQIIINL